MLRFFEDLRGDEFSNPSPGSGGGHLDSRHRERFLDCAGERRVSMNSLSQENRIFKEDSPPSRRVKTARGPDVVSKNRRMSEIPCRSIAIRSTPMPKAKPENSSGS
jgi:hypothetical protein